MAIPKNILSEIKGKDDVIVFLEDENNHYLQLLYKGKKLYNTEGKTNKAAVLRSTPLRSWNLTGYYVRTVVDSKDYFI